MKKYFKEQSAKELKEQNWFFTKCFRNRETCVAHKLYIQGVLQTISLKKLTTSFISSIRKINF